jgi:trans-aconitate 2-methyltransferase
MSWNPDLYEQRRKERERPGRDLLAALATCTLGRYPQRLIDLGCGTGYLSRALAALYPSARLIGLDHDPAMLEKAQELDNPHGVLWRQGNIATWLSQGDDDPPYDLIFSNAALHWLDNHEALIPALVERLAPGGTLAMQMPANFDAPSHRILADLAHNAPWRDRLGDAFKHDVVLDVAAYWRLLRPRCRTVDIWKTSYLHCLDGVDPVLEWLRATALTPLHDRLSASERQSFEEQCASSLRAAYPQEPQGCTLFPFSRLFILAQMAE